MPLSKAKSCDHCRIAKTKCSRELPACSRCRSRLLGCTYESNRQLRKTPNATHRAEFSGEFPGNEGSLPNSALGFFRSGETEPASSTEMIGVSNSSYWPLPTAMFHSPSDVNILNEFIMNAVDSVEDTAQTTVEISRNMPEGLSSFLPASSDGHDFRLFQENTQEPTTQTHTQTPAAAPGLSQSVDSASDSTSESSYKPVTEMQLASKFAHLHQISSLSQRRATTVEPYLIGKAIMGSICSYPQMLIHGGKLPPFIYPHCAFDKGEEFCVSNGAHDCLSEPLSACMCIVKMYYLKRTSASNFIWRTIYSQQEKIHCEFRHYNNHDQLAALQASVIYTLLLALEEETVDTAFVQVLMRSTGEIGSHIYNNEYLPALKKARSISNWSEWIFFESVKRTLGLLYVMEMIFDVFIGHPNREACKGFDSHPLPCKKSLWELKSDRDWQKAVLSARHQKWLVVGQLRRAKGATLAQGVNESWVEDLAEWCLDIDDFGSLIWQASRLNVDHQGQQILS